MEGGGSANQGFARRFYGLGLESEVRDILVVLRLRAPRKLS